MSNTRVTKNPAVIPMPGDFAIGIQGGINGHIKNFVVGGDDGLATGPELAVVRGVSEAASTDAAVAQTAAAAAQAAAAGMAGSATAAAGSATAAAASATAADGSNTAAAASATAAAGSATAADASKTAAAASAAAADASRLLGATIGYATKAAMDADLAHADGTLALVTNDATITNNVTYRKSGASGAGAWNVAADRVSTIDARVVVVEGKAQHIDTGFSLTDADFLWAVMDAQRKVALGLRPDGTLLAKFQAFLMAGASMDSTFSTVDGDIFAITDAAGKIGLRIKGDGTIEGKIGAPGEMIAARGSRVDLSTRISQHLSAYGMPRRHQWGEWYLRETRQRLRKRALAESAQFTIATIGDSWTHNNLRWSGPTESTLRATFGDAGEGWVGFGFAGAGYTLVNGNVRGGAVTFVGAWTCAYASSFSPDICEVTSATVGDEIHYTVSAGASVVKLFAKGGAGVVRYQWNGGTWTNVDLSAMAVALQTVALAGIPAGAGTLNVQVVSGAPVLFGLDVQRATDGVRLHKLGATGSRASQWAGVDATQWQAGMTALAPNLVVIMHGTNDQSAYTAESYRVYMQTIITRVRAALPLADILLMAPCENGRGLANLMSGYASVLYELAAQNKCAYLDLQFLFGETFSEYASTSPRAWFNADTIHPEPLTGGRVIVDAVVRLLTQD